MPTDQPQEISSFRVPYKTSNYDYSFKKHFIIIIF